MIRMTFLCLALLLTILTAWTHSSRADGRPPLPDITVLSVNTITVEFKAQKPQYRIAEINREFSAKQLTTFLNGFYDSLQKNEAAPDILLGRTPKMPFDDSLLKTIRQLAHQHNLTIVQLPPLTNRDPHVRLRDFAKSQHNPNADF